jgi:low affinity Fe/Cu permease
VRAAPEDKRTGNAPMKGKHENSRKAEDARRARPASAERSTFGQGFASFAQAISHLSGRPMAFVLALLLVAVWLVSGPVFRFSDTWQLIINTGTTIVTFLMVFLIQNAQNRDTLALQLKLSELIFAVRNAEDRFATIEGLSDEELEALHEECKERTARVLGALKTRRTGKAAPKRRTDASRSEASKAEAE